MKYRPKRAALQARYDRYPNNMNAAGVPLLGQTGAQAIKNFDLILQRMSFEEREAFELARRQACVEVALQRQVGE